VGEGSVLGYKYFDFGLDTSTRTMEFAVKVVGAGMRGKLHVMIDAPTEEKGGKKIGEVTIDMSDGVYRGRVENVTGRHALYLVAELVKPQAEWMADFFQGRTLCEVEEFVFLK
jgi:hypothetical protein